MHVSAADKSLPVSTTTITMSKVEVLCPNGRRVIVKVVPNTKLLKVLIAWQFVSITDRMLDIQRFKSGSKSKTSNYRLVSLTSQICKIFEAIIRDKMVEFLETHGLIKDSQHGFRRGRSCLTNLLCFLDKVTSCLDMIRTVWILFFLI